MRLGMAQHFFHRTNRQMRARRRSMTSTYWVHTLLREEDIISNAIEALLLQLEDEEQPHARQVHEIASDPSVAQELASGSYLIAVPLVTAKNRSVRVNLSLDKGIVDAIDDAAQMRGLSRSSFLAEAAQNEIRGR